MKDEERIELSRAVAELLGWRNLERAYGSGWAWGEKPDEGLGRRPVWDYATDWGAMREVMDWFRRYRHDADLCCNLEEDYYTVWLYDIDNDVRFVANEGMETGRTLPQAVCNAALALAERLKAKPAS